LSIAAILRRAKTLAKKEKYETVSSSSLILSPSFPQVFKNPTPEKQKKASKSLQSLLP